MKYFIVANEISVDHKHLTTTSIWLVDPRDQGIFVMNLTQAMLFETEEEALKLIDKMKAGDEKMNFRIDYEIFSLTL